MLSFDFEKNCSGCGVCVDVCPTSAISMQLGKGGFYFPKIDTINCINCGKCERVCPCLIVKESYNEKQGLFYAWNRDDNIRLAGSSGSVFYALAQSHIGNGGTVVASGFDENLQLRHQAVSRVADVMPLMKSKYIQSCTIGIFKRIESLLNENIPILFVGTPCQCQALINYVPEHQRNQLTIVDIVCHGVPSQGLFNRCIESIEKQHKCKVIDVSFREKNGIVLRSFLIRAIDNESGKKLSWTGEPQGWSFYNGFLDHTTFRPSCFNCHFKSTKRISDITLGDCWGIESINPSTNELNKGYSMVVVNSRKGKMAIQRIDQDVCLKRFPLSVAVERNHAFSSTDEQTNLNRFFLKWYSRLPMSIIDNLFLTAKPSLFWRCFRKLLRTL